MKRKSIFIAISAATLLVASTLAQHKTSYSSYGKDEQDIQALEEQWRDALLTKNTAVLSQIFADDYIMTDPNGQLQTKSQELAMVQGPDFKLTSCTLRELKPRIFVGGAVVTGLLVFKGTYKGADISGDYRFTDVLETRQNTWKATATQLTKVQKEKPSQSAQPQ